MSEKFSNLPALHLRIGKSALRQRLFVCCCLASLYTGCLMLIEGRFLLGFALLSFYAWVLGPLRKQPSFGIALSWLQGRWYVERCGELRAIELSSRSVLLPWVIYLAWREPPRRSLCRLWLYADSLPRERLRSLRLRLRLQS